MSLLELRLTRAQTTVQNLVAMPSLLQSHKIVSQFLSKYPGDSNSLNFPLSWWALSRDVCFVPAPPNSWSAAHDTPRVRHAVAYEDSHCAPASGVSRHELTPKKIIKILQSWMGKASPCFTTYGRIQENPTFAHGATSPGCRRDLLPVDLPTRWETGKPFPKFSPLAIEGMWHAIDDCPL